MHAIESLLQIGCKLGEGPPDGPRTGDYHIIAPRSHIGWLQRCDQGPQASAYPVADDGAADFLGNSKAEAGFLVGPCGVGTLAGLDHEGRRAPAASAAHAQEFRSFF